MASNLPCVGAANDDISGETLENLGASMVRPYLPLNGLRAFEASARHLSFTRAAIEMCVTQAAVSQQVKSLEKKLGVQLFQRLPKGLKTTAEGEALLPVVTASFDHLANTLERIEGGEGCELLLPGGGGNCVG